MAQKYWDSDTEEAVRALDWRNTGRQMLQTINDATQKLEETRQAVAARVPAAPAFPSLDKLMSGGSSWSEPEEETASDSTGFQSLDSLTSSWFPKQQSAEATPTPSGQPAAMPSNAPRTGNIGSSTITAGSSGSALRPGESVGSVSLAGGSFTPEEAAAIQQAAQEEGVPADLIAAIWDTEQSGAGSVSSAGARGRGQVVPGQGYDLEGEDPTIPLHGARQTARALKDKYKNTGSWDEAGAAYFGYGTDSGGMDTDTYRERVRQNRMKYQGQSAEQQNYPERAGAPQPEARTYPEQSGSADLYPRQDLLDDPDKWAVCGPLGIMAFAAMKGQPIDYQTAKEAARKAGWSPQRGMAGPDSQVAALNSIGVPSKTGPIDVELIRQEVRNGNPVGLSSPGESGHYFTVQGVDDQGRLDLGNSALSLRASGGRRWFTLDELRQMGAIGNVTTAIYVDNPASPTPSVAAQPAQGAARPAAAAPMPSSTPSQPHTGGRVRVRDEWGNEFEISQDDLNKRPAGGGKLTVIGPVALNGDASSSAAPDAAAGAPALHPNVMARWQSVIGHPPTDEEVAQLQQLGLA